MRTKEPTEWVVYKAAAERHLGGHHAVCSQQEWDAIEASLPGVHTLVREHMTNEGEAERLARGLQTVPPVPRVVKPTALALRKQAERVARLAALRPPAGGAPTPPPAAGEAGA